MNLLIVHVSSIDDEMADKPKLINQLSTGIGTSELAEINPEGDTFIMR